MSTGERVASARKQVLIAGASFAGLSSAFWLREMGYQVTIVEIGYGVKQGGAPVTIRDRTLEIVKRMGLFERVVAQRIRTRDIQLQDAAGVIQATLPHVHHDGGDYGGDDGGDYDIERDSLLRMIFDMVHDDVEFIFGDSVAALHEQADGIDVAFRHAPPRSFDLVLGCDGIDSTVRSLRFGDTARYRHALGACFSVTVVDQLLIADNSAQMYTEPGLAAMLNAYQGRTDIVLCFAASAPLAWDRRNEAQQRRLLAERFTSKAWRIPELLAEVKKSKEFYFDELCQIKMPSWASGRVVLVGDAACCASPAAGMGGALAIDAASALAEALARHGDDHALAFRDYEHSFRPYIERVQADAAAFGVDSLLPGTAAAVAPRRSQGKRAVADRLFT